MDWSTLIPEEVNRLFFIHHIAIIGLTITVAILWVKVRNLQKQINIFKGKHDE